MDYQAVGGDTAAGKIEADEPVLDVVGVGRGLKRRDLRGLAGQVAVGVVGVGERVILEEPVGRFIAVTRGEVRARAVADGIVGEGLRDQAAGQRMGRLGEM